MIQLHRAANSIVELMERDLQLVEASNQTFRVLLDAPECARNLAEFADQIMKECIKYKHDEDKCLETFKDLLLLLGQLTAKDSFLLYHQEFLSKRTLESLNEPKTEVEHIFLRRIDEQLGSMSVEDHTRMLKDMEHSCQLSDEYSSKLLLCSFRWSLRVFNPVHWP